MTVRKPRLRWTDEEVRRLRLYRRGDYREIAGTHTRFREEQGLLVEPAPRSKSAAITATGSVSAEAIGRRYIGDRADGLIGSPSPALAPDQAQTGVRAVSLTLRSPYRSIIGPSFLGHCIACVRRGHHRFVPVVAFFLSSTAQVGAREQWS